MLRILGNGFQHFRDKGQYHIFIDTVLCRAELSNWDFAVLGTGILRNTLAVVGTVDIHLAAAIGTIKQACEGSCFAPAVRVASDIPTDFLHKVKGLLVNNGFVRILKNRPFVLRDIMAFLVLEVLSGLEIDGVSQIFTLFKKVADSGRTPAVIATIREENVASWKTIEKCHFLFIEKKMYKDINDDEAQLTRYYEIVV